MSSLQIDMLKFVLIAIIVSLCTTTTVLQFASTILLTDLSLGSIPGPDRRSDVLYNFKYPTGSVVYVDPSGWTITAYSADYFPVGYSIPTWRRQPTAFPSFGEYRQPADAEQNEHVDDTGVLLRAFLPFPDASLRQELKDYTGKTVVLDSRVSCQPPELSNLIYREEYMSGTIDGDLLADPFTLIELNGTVSPSEPLAERLWATSDAVSFSCAVAISKNATSICQLAAPTLSPTATCGSPVLLSNRAGGLLSEFSNLTSPEELAKLQDTFFEAGTHQWPCSVPPFITWGMPVLNVHLTNAMKLLKLT